MLLEEQFERIKAQHAGTEALAIRNTFLRRAAAVLASKIAATFLRRKATVIPFSRHFIIKSDPFVHLTEAKNLEFVAENTSLPVPKVYCSFVRKDRAYIVMERIQGITIAKAWAKLSPESRGKVLCQLKHMIDELRAVETRPVEASSRTRVESCVGGSLRDCRIAHCIPRMGPFESIQEFHHWLRKGFRPSETGQDVSSDELDLADMVERQDGPWPPTVLTHGDLNPFNILVRGDTVVGIIDWEFSGWYPNYWEYTSAWIGNQTMGAWQADLDKFLDAYPEALQMESTRQKWWERSNPSGHDQHFAGITMVPTPRC